MYMGCYSTSSVSSFYSCMIPFTYLICQERCTRIMQQNRMNVLLNQRLITKMICPVKLHKFLQLRFCLFAFSQGQRLNKKSNCQRQPQSSRTICIKPILISVKVLKTEEKIVRTVRERGDSSSSFLSWVLAQLTTPLRLRISIVKKIRYYPQH